MFNVEFTQKSSSLRALVTAVEGALLEELTLGVLLDNRHMGTVTGKLARRQQGVEFNIPLPNYILADRLDLIDTRTGRSILRKAHDLQPIHQFQMDGASLYEGSLCGRFSAHGLDRHVWVEFLHEGKRVAYGFAVLQGDAERPDYVFEVPLLSTSPPGKPFILVPRIAGKLLFDGAVQVTDSDIGYAGVVDVVTAGMVSGWARDWWRPEPVPLDLVVDGEVLSSTLADLYRSDLVGVDEGHGRYGFEFPLQPGWNLQKTRQVSVVVSGTRLELGTSLQAFKPGPSVRGSFDSIYGTSAYGWALNDDEPGETLVVEAVCEGRVVARAEAKQFRGDLVTAGLNEGFCAFEIKIGPQFQYLLGKELSVRVVDTDIVLQGSPKIAA